MAKIRAGSPAECAHPKFRVQALACLPQAQRPRLSRLRACIKNGSRRRDRLCENSEMAFWKNEKRVLGPLAAKENAPYRNCGGRFSRVAGWRGVFAQSGEEADKPKPFNHRPPPHVGGYTALGRRCL